jgi:NAD(P)-dependent dehydrogenase (short-subunit alcohol dehydrogenase family)
MPSVDLAKTPSFRLDGKRALVTGGGRGIGLAAASALAQAGAEVTLLARTAAEIEAAAQAITARGDKAAALQLDVTDLAAVRRIIAAAEPFDVLVNNAGTNRPKPMWEASVEDFDAVIGLNLRSAFFVAQGCVKRMIGDGVGGSLIHMGSQMGHVGGPTRSLYCASKWGLEGMSKAFALDLAAYGIRSNTVAPTFIKTPMTEPYFQDAGFRASVLDKIKLGRLGEVADLLGPVLLLASDAGAMITGTSIVVDGGWTAE